MPAQQHQCSIHGQGSSEEEIPSPACASFPVPSGQVAGESSVRQPLPLKRLHSWQPSGTSQLSGLQLALQGLP